MSKTRFPPTSSPQETGLRTFPSPSLQSFGHQGYFETFCFSDGSQNTSSRPKGNSIKHSWVWPTHLFLLFPSLCFGSVTVAGALQFQFGRQFGLVLPQTRQTHPRDCFCSRTWGHSVGNAEGWGHVMCVSKGFDFRWEQPEMLNCILVAEEHWHCVLTPWTINMGCSSFRWDILIIHLRYLIQWLVLQQCLWSPWQCVVWEDVMCFACGFGEVFFFCVCAELEMTSPGWEQGQEPTLPVADLTLGDSGTVVTFSTGEES